MYRYEDEKISTIQLAVTISSVIVGVGIVTLPRVAVQAVGTSDAWFSFLIAGVLSIMLVLVCAKLVSRHPNQTFYDFVPTLVGKPIALVLILGFVIYWIFLAAYQVRMNGEMIRFMLLESTPLEMNMICFMLVGLYVVSRGPNPMVHLCQFFFPLTTLLIFSILLVSFYGFRLDYFRPVLREGIAPVIEGVPATFLLYLGFEAMMLLGPMLRNQRKLYAAGFFAVAVPMLIYVATLVMVVGNLSPDEVVTLPWPTVDLVRNLEFRGAFFANFEIVFIVIWVIQIFTTFTLSYFFASLGLRHIVHADIRWFYFGVFAVIFVIALLPRDVDEAMKLGEWVTNMGFVFTVFLPLLLLGISYLRGGPSHAERA